MKTRFLTLLAMMPLPLFAQMYETPSTAGILVSLLIFLAVGIVIFLICREIVCWYWKINRMVDNQEEIIRLLEEISRKINGNTNSSQQ